MIDEKMQQQIKMVEVGSEICFGEYVQSDTLSKSKEPIEWVVLDKKEGKALIVTKFAIDCLKYNDEVFSPKAAWKYVVSWETCTLRKWLNGHFLSEAFSDDESGIIQTTNVISEKNPLYSIDPGVDTQDKIFLLSISEANKYFASDELRKCVPTEYTKINGAATNSSFTKDGKPTCWWWLRTPGDTLYTAVYGDLDGSIQYRGYFADGTHMAVRPAMWINLD